MTKLIPNLHEGIKVTPVHNLTKYKTGWYGHIPFTYDDGWDLFIEWTHCRDLFQNASDHSLLEKGMWFCHSNRQGCRESICAFVAKVEEKLNLEWKSYFKQTPYPDVLWCQPSPFWITDFMRRSFFTLILRCGMHYKRKKDEKEDVLYHKYKIAKETIPAIKRFLNGNTFYPYEDPEYSTMGWNFTFAGIKESKLNKELIKQLE